MDIRNRFEMLMYLNVIIKSKNDIEYLQTTVGQLINYVKDRNTEYEFVMRILKKHSNLANDSFDYLRKMLVCTRRTKINSCFEMEGFDFLTSRLYKQPYDTSKYTDAEKYVALMYDMFGIDFSVKSVELCFLNTYKEHIIIDYLYLHSYKEHIMWKECFMDWEEDDKMMIIGNYENESLIFVRDDNVYMIDQCDEYIPECWKYICNVSEVREKLHNTKKYSYNLLYLHE